MTKDILLKLAAMALLLFSYSGACFIFLKKEIASCLKIMIFANLAYCITTAIAVLVYYHNLTIFGIAYFSAEVSVIMSLVYFECKVAGTLKKDGHAWSK